MNYQGSLILRERLRRNWSQEGLCSGICTISYLSKIENGKAEPSEEILRLLMERLGLATSPEMEQQAADYAEEAYELLFSHQMEKLSAVLAEAPYDRYCATAAGLDLLLLHSIQRANKKPLDAALESGMSARQLALQRLLQERFAEARALLPNGYCHFQAGLDAYVRGEYLSALLDLQIAYDQAARDGAPCLMLQCKAFMGNCYSNCRDLSRMQEQYHIARRLAMALQDEEMLGTLDYNLAASQMENGRYEPAYRYFSGLDNPNLMSLHKLAICCEKLGKTEEAVSALDRADAMEECSLELNQARQMCALVRYRLMNAGYLRDEAYGKMLLDCFDMCRESLPRGYADFHLPWVSEWYKATRQYKKALELMSDFPEEVN